MLKHRQVLEAPETDMFHHLILVLSSTEYEQIAIGKPLCVGPTKLLLCPRTGFSQPANKIAFACS